MAECRNGMDAMERPSSTESPRSATNIDVQVSYADMDVIFAYDVEPEPSFSLDTFTKGTSSLRSVAF